MKAYINHHLFTEQPLDSGALTMACSIVHNFPEPGAYTGSVLIGNQVDSIFHLAVDETYPAMQVVIDLAETGRAKSGECACGTGREKGQHFEINPKGFVVFYVSGGAGGYAVKVSGKLKSSERLAQFDSRELMAGDMFTVSLLRPGTHTLTNSTGAKGKIVVAYPGSKKGKELFNRAKPIEVRCTDKEFIPKEIEAQAAQGQVYRIETKASSRIKIELAKGDDGPKVERSTSIFKWNKPPRPKASSAKPAPGQSTKSAPKK